MKQPLFVKRGYFWFCAFAFIFLMTQDYLTGFGAGTRLAFGLPAWLYYFIGVHLLLVLAILAMTKWYWSDE